MVRPGQVITGRLRGIMPEEDGARVPDTIEDVKRIVDRQFEMLGGNPVTEVDRFEDIRGDNDRPEIADRLGFASAYYFSRIFKQRNGCSPSIHREYKGKLKY